MFPVGSSVAVGVHFRHFMGGNMRKIVCSLLTGMPDASCDVICSQDALLLAGFERYKAVAEAARALKPGGRLVFSDFMQAEGVDPKDMQEVTLSGHAMSVLL